MPRLYDYPGEYAMRFDGEDKPSPWCGYFASMTYSESSKTLTITRLRVADLVGRMEMERWRSAAGAAGAPPKNLVIEALDRLKMPVKRWRVRNARPTKWVLAPSPSSAGRNEVAIETLEIVHEGFEPA
ncbi:MAG: phage tail protein [Bryobacteraceae bacterium]|nr:phage tail protein [Bryobacteraceae bacterium]